MIDLDEEYRKRARGQIEAILYIQDKLTKPEGMSIEGREIEFVYEWLKVFDYDDPHSKKILEIFKNAPTMFVEKPEWKEARLKENLEAYLEISRVVVDELLPKLHGYL